jgi:hypothetical protein
VNFALFDVVLLLLFGAAGLYFFNGIRVRELALQQARRACDREDAQLLDESVGVQRVSLSRDRDGRWHVWRQYRFEYSLDGVERRRGNVIMLGFRCEGLVMGEHTLH